MSQLRARTRRSSAVVLSAVCLGTMAMSAGAETFTWAGNTGNFSDPTQWTGGAAPTGLNPYDALTFGGGTAYTATNDIAVNATRAAFYFGSINLATNVDGSSIVAGGAGNPGTFPQQTMLRAATSTTTLNATGSGSFMVAQPISIAKDATLTVNVAPGAGTLWLANRATPALLEANGFFGPGTLTINNQSGNPVYLANLGGLQGNFNVTAGVVRAADSTTTQALDGNGGTGGGDTLHNQTLVNVSAGATFDLNGNGETMGGISGAGTIQLGATGGLGMNYMSDLAWAGTIAQLPLGAGQITKAISSGKTTYTFTGDNTYGGRTNVDAGTLKLSGGGKLSGTANIFVTAGAALVLDNTAQNVNDRINPAATITSLSGTVSLIGAPGAASTQTLSTVTVGGQSGEAAINVVNGSGGGTATLTLGTFDRSGRGTFANFTGNGTVIINSPTLVGGILGFATVNMTDWATVDGSNKVVPLATYQTSADPAAWAATDNVKVAGPLAGPIANGADQTLNSLLIASNDTVNIGQSLQLASGGILATSSATINGGSIYGGQSGSGEVIVAVADGQTLTVNSNIVNTVASGLLKAGPGKLVLGGTNTYGNSTRLLGGTLSISSASNIPSAGNVTLNAGTLEITADVTLGRAVVTNGDASIDTGPHTLTLTGTVGGTSTSRNEGNLTKRGSGVLVLQTGAANTGLFNSSGNLTILEGTVRPGQGDTINNGSLVTVAAGAVLDLSFDTSGEDLGAIQGAGDVWTSQAGGVGWAGGAWPSVTFSGRILPYSSGTPALTGGSLSKSGAGSLTVTGASQYTGGTTVTNGHLILGASAMPNVPGPFGNAATPVLVGGTGANETANPGLYIGAAGVTLGRDVQVRATPGPWGTPSIGATHTSGSSTFSGAIALDRAAELNVAAGGTTSLTGVVSGVGALHKVNGGTAVLSAANTFAGGLIVSDGTLVVTQPAAIGGGSVRVNGGTLSAAAEMAQALAPTTLTISGAGTLDLNDNDLVIEYASASPLAAVRAAVAAARNGGLWDQPGITSTSARNANGLTTLAVFEASDIGATQFAGVNVDGTAVLVKYTYYGDVNTDGRINGDDLALADRSLALGGLAGAARWVDGDVNQDLVVNSQDFLLIDRSLALWGGVPLAPDFLAGRAAQFGDGYIAALVASVPEPSVVAMAAVAAAGLAGRRRRRA